MTHELKILPQYFEAVQVGLKNFEIRQNDRGFTEGDTLILKEWNTGYTGREIEKEISYVLYGGQYGIEKGYCIASLKQEGILLKNINLTGISGNQQLKKVKEEFREFTDSMCQFIVNEGNMESKNHFIEEYFDLVQSALGLLERFGISADEVMREYPKHLEKIKNRPRIRLKDNNNYDDAED
jgi:phosphoribosyl-ATP pyrophosphohydrolase